MRARQGGKVLVWEGCVVPLRPASFATASTFLLSPGMITYMFSYTDKFGRKGNNNKGMMSKVFFLISLTTIDQIRPIERDHTYRLLGPVDDSTESCSHFSFLVSKTVSISSTSTHETWRSKGRRLFLMTRFLCWKKERTGRPVTWWCYPTNKCFFSSRK